ncbi:hypothetical protein C1X65_14330 [Pseudomonas sp. FW305-70]|nr:hypothetical protein C1X65_14330 [Pseudomonas sp. FW305-70]
MLAMVVNDYACLPTKRGALSSIVGTPPGASSLLQGVVFGTSHVVAICDVYPSQGDPQRICHAPADGAFGPKKHNWHSHCERPRHTNKTRFHHVAPKPASRHFGIHPARPAHAHRR